MMEIKKEVIELLDKNKVKISQSLLKGIMSIRSEKKCGLVVKAKFIDGRYEDFATKNNSEEIEAGVWFEYQCTGALPKAGYVPEKKDTKIYYNLAKQIENYHDVLKHYSLEVVQAPLRVVHKDTETGLTFEINIDILCRAKRDIYNEEGEKIVEEGQYIIVDLKTTGLLENKWEDLGWHLDRLTEKVKIMAQPEHYIYVWWKKYNNILPFMWFVFSSNNGEDYKIINPSYDFDSLVQEHEAWIMTEVMWINKYLKHGFPANPSLKECKGCPLAEEGCKHKIDVPKIITVYKQIGL